MKVSAQGAHMRFAYKQKKEFFFVGDLAWTAAAPFQDIQVTLF
jgi:hypothetical protein